MFYSILDLSFFYIHVFFSIFTIENFKNIAEIITGFASIATIFLVGFSYKQFKLFNKEYKTKNQPKVIPYIDIMADNSTSEPYYLAIKIYNASEIVAKNIGISINEKWLDKLNELNKESAKNFLELSKVHNIYITNKQEHCYMIGETEKCKELFWIPLEIKITYYEDKERTEAFPIDLKNIRYKLKFNSQESINDLRKVAAAKDIYESLNAIKTAIQNLKK